MKVTMAKELWDKFEAKYMQKSVENKLYLKKNFNKIITNLLNLDVKIEDEDKSLLLLNSLPESYKFLVTTLLHGITDIDFEDV